MKQFLDFGVLTRLKNYDIFKTVRVSFDTIEWDTGIDLDPEFIYIECKKANQALEKDREMPGLFGKMYLIENISFFVCFWSSFPGPSAFRWPITTI